MPAATPLPPLADLRRLFAPDFENGLLPLRAPTSRVAVTFNNGRHRVRIDGVWFYRYRILWSLYTGMDIGNTFIDHVNRDPGDDRITNLRPTTRSANARNTRPRTVSGYRGVYPVDRVKQPVAWDVRIKASGKTQYFGRFDSLQEAAAKAAEVFLGLGDYDYKPEHLAMRKNEEVQDAA